MARSTKCRVVAFVLAAAALHLTDASQPGGPAIGFGQRQEGPCFEAVHPESWPVKPESQICGSDGFLYPSKNALECENINRPSANNVTEQPRENCDSKTKPYDACILFPYIASRKVCGSDNVTYTNVWNMACTANRHNVKISVQKEGECDIECPYSPIYKPVCSSHNYTYANEEALKCRQILQPYDNTQLQHLGACKRDKANKPCYHTSFYKPTCASNGRTYDNAQNVHCLKESNPKIEVLHDGACTTEEVEKIIGLDDVCRMAMHAYQWSPLCGSDNVTYSNAYTFLCTSKDTKLEIAYTGECGAFDYCREPTPVDAQPVCATDGVTYPHDNAFYCAQSKNYQLNKKRSGPCDKVADDPCVFRNDPFSGSKFLDNGGNAVCGSDKVTYVTPQALWCAASTKPDIKFLHSGECF